MTTRRLGAVPAVAGDVLRYFLRSPRAADTLEGIARWRLLDERIQRRIEEVDRALTWLVGAGFLVERSTPGSAPLFLLNRTKVAEAAQLVVRARRLPGKRRAKA